VYVLHLDPNSKLSGYGWSHFLALTLLFLTADQDVQIEVGYVTIQMMVLTSHSQTTQLGVQQHLSLGYSSRSVLTAL